jgi:hypothetical protein
VYVPSSINHLSQLRARGRPVWIDPSPSRAAACSVGGQFEFIHAIAIANAIHKKQGEIDDCYKCAIHAF